MGVPLAVGLDECGIHCYNLTSDDSTFDELLHQASDDCLEPLWADAGPEPCELGGVVGLLSCLDVADHPQRGIVPQSPVEFSVAGYLPQPLGHQCLEDSQRVSGGSAWAFLVVCLLEGFLDVV